MRLAIIMSANEERQRNACLAQRPDDYVYSDQGFHRFAEAVWALTREELEGIDLQDSTGRYLYTLQGEPR